MKAIVYLPTMSLGFFDTIADIDKSTAARILDFVLGLQETIDISRNKISNGDWHAIYTSCNISQKRVVTSK